MTSAKREIQMHRLLKYEFLNVIRNRWLVFFSALLFVLTFSLIRITGDFGKSLVILSTISVVLIPLVAIIFTTVSWYYSERFTELFLTQPIPRKKVFVAKKLSWFLSMAVAVVIFPLMPFIIFGHFSWDLLLYASMALFLIGVFVSLGVLVAVHVQDRIKGIGVALALWFYLALIHDGVMLLLLVGLKNFPMDLPVVILSSLNPVGLTRVVILIALNTELLLGHSGVLIQNFLLGWGGKILEFCMGLMWLTLPAFFAFQKFRRKDF